MFSKIIWFVLAGLVVSSVGGSANYSRLSPQEAEEKAAIVEEQLAENGIEFDGVVYWTSYGKAYHLDADCTALRDVPQSNLYSGTLEEAFEAGHTDPCDFCALIE